jgi:hypothetical protein
VLLKDNTNTLTSNVSNIKKIDGDIQDLHLECTMDYGEDDLNVVTEIVAARSSNSTIFFAVSSCLFLAFITFFSVPYIYFGTACFLNNNAGWVTKKEELTVLLGLILFIVDLPLLIIQVIRSSLSESKTPFFEKDSVITWGNFFISFLFNVVGLTLVIVGFADKNNTLITSGSAVFGLLIISVFSIFYHSNQMQKNS